MKKLLMISLFIVVLSGIALAQTTYRIPETGTPIVKVDVPTDKWTVTNKDGLFSVVPKDSGESSRLVTMIWASANPNSETATDDLVNEAFDVVESLLVDITWAEEMSDFESNGISFIANDGWGYYKNEDGSKDQMSTTVMIFFPDDKNLMTLVFFGTVEAYDKWEKSLLEIVLSIKPSSL